MRVLMLSPLVPWPLDMGSKIRIYHVLKELSSTHDVELACLAQETSAPDVSALEELASRLHVVTAWAAPRWQMAAKSLLTTQPYRVAKFHSEALNRRLADLLHAQSYDLIWIHFLNMTSHLSPATLDQNVVVLDQHNADERMWQRYAEQGSSMNRVFAQQNLWKLRRFQRRTLQHVDVLLSVSDEEAEFMRSRAPVSCEVWTMPNGVDIDYFQPRDDDHNEPDHPIILFCGSMDVTMNADAVTRFIEEIFPQVKDRIPSAEFWIVGRRPTRKVQELGQLDGVTVTGAVEDVRPYYQRAAVFVAPFRYGAGTKLKVLEAMAMGVPVVATAVGCQGIDVESGRHLYVEETDETLAERVVELLDDPDARDRLATAGRALVEETYSWHRIVSDTIQRLERRLMERGRLDRG